MKIMADDGVVGILQHSAKAGNKNNKNLNQKYSTFLKTSLEFYCGFRTGILLKVS